MKTILTVFKKELVDSLRDRRTLVAMVFVPLVLFPLLISISSSMLISHEKKAAKKTLRIGLVMNGNAAGFKEMLSARGDVKLKEGITPEEGMSLVKADSLDAVFVFDPTFDERGAALGAGKVSMYHKSTENSAIEKRRARSLLDDFEKALREKRFEALALDLSIIDAVDVGDENLASTKEQLADQIGGLLPS